MNTLPTRIAAVAALALAALPIAALATNASAQPSPMTVQVNDIDLNTAEGMASFNARAEAVAKAFCANADPTPGQMHLRTDCRQAVRAEIRDKLVPAQQKQLAAKADKAAVTLATR